MNRELFVSELNEIRRNCKIQFYPNDKYKVTCFSFGVFREKGFEALIPKQRLDLDRAELTKEEKEKNKKDSLRRSRNKVFEIALANEWETMVTFTIDDKALNRYEPKEILRPVTKWLHNQVQRKGIKYLVVPEYHQDGAIHFHGLCSGLKLTSSGTFKSPLSKKPIKRETLLKQGLCENSEGVKEVFNVSDYKYGFSTALKIDENKEAIAKYMTKYITKDLQMIFGNYYFAGGDINRTLPNILESVDYNAVKSDLEFETDFCKVKYLMLENKEELERFIVAVKG